MDIDTGLALLPTDLQSPRHVIKSKANFCGLFVPCKGIWSTMIYEINSYLPGIKRAQLLLQFCEDTKVSFKNITGKAKSKGLMYFKKENAQHHEKDH